MKPSERIDRRCSDEPRLQVVEHRAQAPGHIAIAFPEISVLRERLSRRARQGGRPRASHYLKEVILTHMSTTTAAVGTR